MNQDMNPNINPDTTSDLNQEATAEPILKMEEVSKVVVQTSYNEKLDKRRLYNKGRVIMSNDNSNVPESALDALNEHLSDAPVELKCPGCEDVSEDAYEGDTCECGEDYKLYNYKLEEWLQEGG